MKIRKMIWSKIRSPFKKQGGSREDHDAAGLPKNSDNVVDEEYANAFRTKSYVDICHKVQGQIGRSAEETCSSSSSMPQDDVRRLSEVVLEPRQESLDELIRGCGIHHLLISYFDNSFKACRTCELLLSRIRETRANYRAMKRAVKLLRRVSMAADGTNEECHAVYRELESFALLKNPLSTISHSQFQSIHDDHVLLLHNLASLCRKIRTRAKFFKWFQKFMASVLVLVCSALAITLSVLAIHSMVGVVVAAPGLMATSLLMLQKLKQTKKIAKTSPLERLEAQLDVAAKGVYVLINDFDTISRLVRILSDEMDRNKSIVEMCIARGNREMLREVTREFQTKETRFLQQLQELEECLYLCFLNINRSRRLVVEKVKDASL